MRDLAPCESEKGEETLSELTTYTGESAIAQALFIIQPSVFIIHFKNPVGVMKNEY